MASSAMIRNQGSSESGVTLSQTYFCQVMGFPSIDWHTVPHHTTDKSTWAHTSAPYFLDGALPTAYIAAYVNQQDRENGICAQGQEGKRRQVIRKVNTDLERIPTINFSS